MPGRVVGKTKDKNGKDGYVLTLQTREQHIRRERATSNICSNESLCAIASAVYLSYMGPHGMASVAKTCFDRAEYAKKKIAQIGGYSLLSNSFTFKEFCLKMPLPAKKINNILKKKKIMGGYDLSIDYPDMKNTALFCFTEMTSIEDIDKLACALNITA